MLKGGDQQMHLLLLEAFPYPGRSKKIVMLPLVHFTWVT